MLVDIEKEIGDFSLSIEQLEKLYEIALSQKEMSKEDKELFIFIESEYNNLKNYDPQVADAIFGSPAEIYCPFIGMTHEEIIRFRSHPWLIATEKAIPNKNHELCEINTNYYTIITNEMGIEFVITPELNNFVKGYEQ